ncbi:uncharacterized protein RHO25_000632 [Cercospora beticola]|uniref:Uncharacterized protein n=1 Tax=Cercospora beticola TaxID=122368 RepID=A0ABZ0N905_CERBT|nr:hypothetical protein RHO25_000632 [Cercospora beticola]
MLYIVSTARHSGQEPSLAHFPTSNHRGGVARSIVGHLVAARCRSRLSSVRETTAAGSKQAAAAAGLAPHAGRCHLEVMPRPQDCDAPMSCPPFAQRRTVAVRERRETCLPTQKRSAQSEVMVLSLRWAGAAIRHGYQATRLSEAARTERTLAPARNTSPTLLTALQEPGAASREVGLDFATNMGSFTTLLVRGNRLAGNGHDRCPTDMAAEREREMGVFQAHRASQAGTCEAIVGKREVQSLQQQRRARASP